MHKDILIQTHAYTRTHKTWESHVGLHLARRRVVHNFPACDSHICIHTYIHTYVYTYIQIQPGNPKLAYTSRGTALKTTFSPMTSPKMSACVHVGSVCICVCMYVLCALCHRRVSVCLSVRMPCARVGQTI
jgi:hypothetical protein